MEKCLGVLMNKDIDNNFGYLCRNRPNYMLPYGGRYRLIDVPLSNLVNHGIKTVALYTGDKIRSTMDHLADGRPWGLNRRFAGLFLFPPVYDEESGGKTGDISQLYSTEQFLKHTKEQYVFISNTNILAKVNLKEAFKKFIHTDTDIMLIYKKQRDPQGNYINVDKLHLDEEGNLIKIGLNLGVEKQFNLDMEMCFIKKSVFLSIIREAMETGDTRSFKEAMLMNKGKWKINTYEFKGHIEMIKNLRSYYEANLNLLNSEVYKGIFVQDGTVYTKAKDEPPTIYTESSKVQNSVIANGCVIEGKVENSIIFRGVKVGKNAIVKNSILMHKSGVSENAVVVNSIIDKHALIDKGVNIAGSSHMPYVVQKHGKIRKD